MPNSLRLAVSAIGLCAVLGLPLCVSTGAQASAASKLKAYDTDKDGTIDLKEVTAGAGTTFDALDKDKDGTIDSKELQGRLSNKELAADDPDHDKTLSKDEYTAAVTAAFKAADKDNDGSLDEKELKTPAGQVILRLLK